jgi:hypothetical protein
MSHKEAKIYNKKKVLNTGKNVEYKNSHIMKWRLSWYSHFEKVS